METVRVQLPDVKGAQWKLRTKHGDMVVSTSGYDVPQYMDVSIDKAAHSLQIAFGYLGEEESEPVRVDPNLTLLIGIKSGKLIGIQAKNISGEPGEILLGLVNGLERQRQHATRDNQRLNYETIKGVMEDRGVLNRMAPLLTGA